MVAHLMYLRTILVHVLHHVNIFESFHLQAWPLYLISKVAGIFHPWVFSWWALLYPSGVRLSQFEGSRWLNKWAATVVMIVKIHSFIKRKSFKCKPFLHVYKINETGWLIAESNVRTSVILICWTPFRFCVACHLKDLLFLSVCGNCLWILSKPGSKSILKSLPQVFFLPLSIAERLKNPWMCGCVSAYSSTRQLYTEGWFMKQSATAAFVFKRIWWMPVMSREQSIFCEV